MNAIAHVSKNREALLPQVISGQAASTPALRYPLTKKALAAAFAELVPEGISLTKTPNLHEAVIQGEWPLSRLLAHFKALGFKPVGKQEQLLFSNDEQTVGFRLQGMSPKPNSNTWRTYYVEVDARPLSAVGCVSRGTVLWG